MKTWITASAVVIAMALILVSADLMILNRLEGPPVYLVAPDVEAARHSILNSANVALPSKSQAEAYAASRPGTHVFEIDVRLVK